MVNSGKRQVAICLDKGALFVLVVIWAPSCSLSAAQRCITGNMTIHWLTTKVQLRK